MEGERIPPPSETTQNPYNITINRLRAVEKVNGYENFCRKEKKGVLEGGHKMRKMKK